MKVGTSTLGRAVAVACLAAAAACGPRLSDHDARLLPDQEEEEQVVNYGYGVQSAADVTGSTATVRTEDIENLRASRVEELLENRIPGLEVIRTGQGYSMRIRGISSILSSNEPLVIVDGMPVHLFGAGSGLGWLNPYDIERIDVLKDASSTAIYGSRGANGVIIITTKRPR
ncbi:MAG TPA: TonB-dependent receptor plug domain-containing protein [Longimicrobiaceae bacterium]